MPANIIVGSGITGTLIANQLKHVHIDATVLEQSKNRHGRLETKDADTGAQFFTVRSEEFKELVDQWKDQKLVKVWCEGFPPKNDEYPRYCAVDGMGKMVEQLSHGNKIEYDTTVLRIVEEEDKFVLHTNKGKLESDHVILTAPLPESLKLVKDIIPKNEYKSLSQVEYWPCISLTIKMNEPFKVGDSGAYQHKGEIVDFIANNHSKGITENEIITIHCSPEFSEQYLNKADMDIKDQIQLELDHIDAIKGLKLKDHEVELLKWKYSQPKTPFNERFYHYKNGKKHLLIAGDGFLGSKIEGACLSALDASNALFKDFQVFY